jgi:hypothetical protein
LRRREFKEPVEQLRASQIKPLSLKQLSLMFLPTIEAVSTFSWRSALYWFTDYDSLLSFEFA